jgi:hypothetical protein
MLTIIAVLRLALLTTLCAWVTTSSLASEVLFYRESDTYGQPGRLGKVYQREFEKRMFTHQTWRQRLYYFSPDSNETIEIYSKPDGSRWLSCRRATPSLSGIIRSRIVDGEHFDLKRQLDHVHIYGCEVALPLELARDLELLWQKMLPGLPDAPTPPVVYVHAPIFIAFARKNGSVATGSMLFAPYNTKAYRSFLDIVQDLKEACDRSAAPSETILRKLPAKVKRLTALLR